MEYFAGLDVSMEETHVIVVDRDGKVILETRTPTAPKTIAAALAKGPAVERVLFETGRMAPMLFHGLTALGLPVVCVESRQAYQALRSLAAHKTDRNDARGLAHLARTGFFKPVHVKSLPSHAVRALLAARKKLVGQRVTLENQIRGLAVAFGVRLPRGLSSGFAEKAMAAGCGIPGLDGAMRAATMAATSSAFIWVTNCFYKTLYKLSPSPHIAPHKYLNLLKCGFTAARLAIALVVDSIEVPRLLRVHPM
jgi:transposase